MVQMMRLLETVKGTCNDEKGQGMVEYGLILGLVAVIAIISLTSIGTSLGTAFTTLSTKI
jgi:pilus assembly protein Flp/PilA